MPSYIAYRAFTSSEVTESAYNSASYTGSSLTYAFTDKLQEVALSTNANWGALVDLGATKNIKCIAALNGSFYYDPSPSDLADDYNDNDQTFNVSFGTSLDNTTYTTTTKSVIQLRKNMQKNIVKDFSSETGGYKSTRYIRVYWTKSSYQQYLGRLFIADADTGVFAPQNGISLYDVSFGYVDNAVVTKNRSGNVTKNNDPIQRITQVSMKLLESEVYGDNSDDTPTIEKMIYEVSNVGHILVVPETTTPYLNTTIYGTLDDLPELSVIDKTPSGERIYSCTLRVSETAVKNMGNYTI